MINVELVEFVKNSTCCKLHKGASDAEIKNWKRSLGPIKIPESYEQLLRCYGYIEIGADVIFGLGPDTGESNNVRDINTFERVMADPQMRADYIPIMADGFGNHFCLDTTRIKNGDCPVVFWQHDHPNGDMQRVKAIDKSFVSWITKKIMSHD